MTERKPGQNFSQEIAVKTQSKFQTVAPGVAFEITAFLKLAEREGAYANLSEKRRETLEMRFVQGLSMPEIATRLGISKQAVSQRLKLSPEALYKQMVKDVITYRTNISFREILVTYSAYRDYLDGRKKSDK